MKWKTIKARRPTFAHNPLLDRPSHFKAIPSEDVVYTSVTSVTVYQSLTHWSLRCRYAQCRCCQYMSVQLNLHDSHCSVSLGRVSRGRGVPSNPSMSKMTYSMSPSFAPDITIRSFLLQSVESNTRSSFLMYEGSPVERKPR